MPREGTLTGAVGTAGPTRARRVRDSLRIAQGLVLILLGAVIFFSGAAGSTESQVAHGGLALGEVLLGLHVLVRGPRVTQVVVGGVLLAAAAAPLFAGDGDGSDGVAAACVTLCAVRALAGKRCALTLAGLAAIYVSVRAGFGYWNVLESLQRTVPGSIDSWAGGACARYLERGATRADAEAQAADREELAVARHDAVIEALRQTQRVLHDEVLVALSATTARTSLSRTTPGPDPDARTLSATAVRSVAALEESAPASGALSEATARTTVESESLEDLVSAVLRSAPLEVSLRMDVDDASTHLSTPVADAAKRALGEGLRNVVLHTKCERAAMLVRSVEGEIEIVLSDKGSGVDVSQGRGFGIDGSIREPIEATGGTAAVQLSTRGTEVHLRLPTQHRQPRLDVIARARAEAEAAGGPIGGLIVPITIPLLTAQGVLNIEITHDLPHSDRWALLTIALLVTGALHSWIVSKRPLSSVTELLFLTWLLGLVAGVVLLAPSAANFTADSIIWGSAGIYLFIWLFFMPLTWGIATLSGGLAILVMAWSMAPAATAPAYLVTSGNGFLLIPFFSAILGALVRRDGRAVMAERARRLSRLSELELRRQLSRAVSLHLDHTRRVIVPWLARVAEGELDPADPAVRAHARVLEREARDDLHAAGFFDDRLREDVSRYRANGGTVEIRPGLRPGSHARVTGALLGSLVTTLPPRHRITVSPTPQDPERARVAVVPPPPAPLPAALPRGARLLEHDQDRLVLTVAEWTEPVVA